jgi:hypothetical protein
MSYSPINVEQTTPSSERRPSPVGVIGIVIARASRIFRDNDARWTLEATCAECSTETVAPLVMGEAIRCRGCGAVIRVDPGRTTYQSPRYAEE